MPKVVLTLLGAGIFPAKDGKDRWVLRENSHRERAAVGLLGFCLKFILLGKEMDHWAQARKKHDVLQEGSRGILLRCVVVPCGTVSVSHPFLGLHLPSVGCAGGDPGPLLPKEGQKILLCYPVSRHFVQMVFPSPG